MNSRKTNRPLCSVEFSHIYVDEEFSETQLNSINFLKETSRSWSSPYSTAILFDNYNIEKSVIPIDEFFQELEKHGALPDFWAFEKDLIAYSGKLLSLIKAPKIKRQYRNYIDNKHIYPCSFLTTIWYFLRLGYIEDTHGLIYSIGDKPFTPSEKLVNILAKDFSNVEETTLKLIKATDFKDAVEQIQNLFYENTQDSTHNNKLLL